MEFSVWQRELGRDVGGDAEQAQHAHVQRLATSAHGLEVGGGQVLDAQHQRTPAHHLLDRLGVRGDLVADGGADQVRAIGVEAFLHEEVDLAEVDEAHVDRDLLVDGLGAGGGSEGWHAAILTPSKWMDNLHNSRGHRRGAFRKRAKNNKKGSSPICEEP